MPPLVLESITHHHRPSDSPERIVAAVHLGDILCRGLEIGNGGDGGMPQLEDGVLDKLGMDWPQVSGCLAEIDQLNANANLFL